MDTNKLIKDLSNDLQPVKRLRPPLVRASAWMGFALFCIVVAILPLGGHRLDFFDAMHNATYQIENLLALIAGVFASIAVFKLSIPNTKISLSVISMIALAATIWLGLNIINFSQTTGATLQDAWYLHAGIVHHCLVELVTMTLIPLGVLIYMLRKAAPVHLFLAGFSGLLAISSFASIGMRILCRSDEAAHLFFWHYAPVILLAGIGLVLGRLLFRW